MDTKLMCLRVWGGPSRTEESLSTPKRSGRLVSYLRAAVMESRDLVLMTSAGWWPRANMAVNGTARGCWSHTDHSTWSPLARTPNDCNMSGKNNKTPTHYSRKSLDVNRIASNWSRTILNTLQMRKSLTGRKMYLENLRSYYNRNVMAENCTF